MTYTGDAMDLAHQDYHEMRAREAELRERALTRFPEHSLGEPAYPGGPPVLLSGDRISSPREQQVLAAAQHEEQREWLRDGGYP